MALLTHANGSSNFSKRTGSGCRGGTIFKSEGDGEYMHCPVLCSEQANNVEKRPQRLGRETKWKKKSLDGKDNLPYNHQHHQQ